MNVNEYLTVCTLYCMRYCILVVTRLRHAYIAYPVPLTRTAGYHSFVNFANSVYSVNLCTVYKYIAVFVWRFYLRIRVMHYPYLCSCIRSACFNLALVGLISYTRSSPYSPYVERAWWKLMVGAYRPMNLHQIDSDSLVAIRRRVYTAGLSKWV